MREASSPHLQICGITKRFPGVVALDDVSLTINAGELHAIVGENGAGKSTLMKILSGVIVDYDGELQLRGEVRKFRGTRDAEQAGISIIHQELNLVEELSVSANIFLGRECTNAIGLLDEKTMHVQAAALFERLHAAIPPQVPVGSLRVGDQQLVEIAKALSLNAEILIMDEPTSALTESEVARLFTVIEHLQGQGVTILYISHKMEEVFQLADRITVLRDGKLVQSLEASTTNPKEVTHLMVGRDIEDVELGQNRTPGPAVLETRNLSLPWPGHARKWRLQDISFHLHKGEVLGVAGLMGAGRTELLECLFGIATELPTGEILIDGEQVNFDHPATAMQKGVALVTEDRKRLSLFPQMNVRENITICTLDDTTTLGLVSRNHEKERVLQTVDRLGVKTPSVEAPIGTLSGGNQQKCVIGRWLETEPRILLLDDPTRGIDVGAKAELYKLIDGLCSEGMAILLTSSELPELIMLCDRILVLCEGRQTRILNREEFSEQAILEAATAM